MRAILPKGSRTTALLLLTIVLGAPALASAQLFPNLPIRRERPDCSHENPQYKMIRQEYWGYYPTCWRKFPPGWGCPSPEAPNWEKSKQDIPFVLEPSEGGADGGRNRDRGGDAGTETPPDGGTPRGAEPGTKPRTPFPPLPEERTSPFDTNPKPATPPAGDTKPRTDVPRLPGDPATPVDAPKAPTPPNLNGPNDGPTPPPLGATNPTSPRRGRLMAGLFGGRRR